jgi:hypothetical protein
VADTVKVQLSAHRQGKAPGDTVEVSTAEAKRLISGGIAVAATVNDAKATGTDPDAAATKRS